MKKSSKKVKKANPAKAAKKAIKVQQRIVNKTTKQVARESKKLSKLIAKAEKRGYIEKPKAKVASKPKPTVAKPTKSEHNDE